MKILVFDTSTDTLTVGIYDGNRCVAEYHKTSFTKHSGIFFKVLEELMKKKELCFSAIKALAVGLGPGSFTGLRVGITAAKVMAYAGKMKVIAMSSHEVSARNAEAFDGQVAVLADAKKGNVYCSIYERGRCWKVIRQPAVMMLASFLKKIKRPTFFVVDDWNRYAAQILDSKQHCFAGAVEKDLSTPKASIMATAARERIRQNKFTDPFKLVPMYVYPRDCNVVNSSLKKPHLRRCARRSLARRIRNIRLRGHSRTPGLDGGGIIAAKRAATEGSRSSI